MKITLSKQQWENIGKQAKWLNKTALYDNPNSPEEANYERSVREKANSEDRKIMDEMREDRRIEEKVKKWLLKPLFEALGKNFGTLGELQNVLKAASLIEQDKGDLNANVANLKRTIRTIL